MALLGWTRISQPWIFIVLWALEGYFQSAVLPGCISVMGKWFPSSVRGKVMGVWSSNASVGNIFGTIFTTFMFIVFLTSWEVTLTSLSSFMLLIGVLFRQFVTKSPFEEQQESLLPKQEKLSFWSAWSLPGVVPYTLTYACGKVVNYSVIMWFPFYLQTQLHLDSGEIGVIIALYDLGAVFGSSMGGWISDKLQDRLIVIIGLVMFSLPNLLGVKLVTDVGYFYVIVPLLGASVAGCCYLITGTVSAELAQNGQTGVISGIIDGTGSLAAGFSMILIGYLQSVSWQIVFSFMIFVNSISLVPPFVMLLKRKIAQ